MKPQEENENHLNSIHTKERGRGGKPCKTKYEITETCVMNEQKEREKEREKR